jgi:uncharacterized protein (DUF1697 family)
VTTRFAFLRAVNLGPTNKVSMTELKSLLADLDYENPRSLLNSGNLIFESDQVPAKLEKRLEMEVQKRLGLDTEIMVRTASDLAKIVKANPFKKEAKSDPAHLMVTFCKTAVPKNTKVSGQNRERYKIAGREIYATYPDGFGRSKFKIDARGTTRNWNTVLKLAALG